MATRTPSTTPETAGRGQHAPDGGPAGEGGKRIKRTFHLDPDAVFLLAEIQVAELRRTGRKPELSELVSQAILQHFGTERRVN